MAIGLRLMDFSVKLLRRAVAGLHRGVHSPK